MRYRSLALALCAIGIINAETITSHGIANEGQLKYKAGFTAFEYANPNAPKKGKVVWRAIGSYDSFNAFIDKGDPAAGVGNLFATLMVGSGDEVYSSYGYLAEQIEYPTDRKWVIFHLRKDAKFSDGTPITAKDVLFSFNTLKEKGSANIKQSYRDITSGTVTDSHTIRFDFSPESQSKELIFVIGGLPVFASHDPWAQAFDGKLVEPIASNGYTIKAYKAGMNISYSRVPNFWGDKTAVHAGIDNFNTVEYKYFKDTDVAFEAFKAGEFDIVQENMSKRWNTGYTGPAFDEGKIKKEFIPDGNPIGMQAYWLNIRRPQFQDIRVRKAMELAFDFEWSNDTFMYGAYDRNYSYFMNSDFAADLSQPPKGAELELLQSISEHLVPGTLTDTISMTKTDGSGNNRDNLRKALMLLREAGYKTVDGKLINKDGKPFEMVLLGSGVGGERLALPWIENLKTLGITMTYKGVEHSQWVESVLNYDFDLTTLWLWNANLSPGMEQKRFFGSEAADTPYQYNFIGLKNPGIDILLDKIANAQNMDERIIATRALDRALMHGYYGIPQWHLAADRVAYWDKFVKPPIKPKYYIGFNTWWANSNNTDD